MKSSLYKRSTFRFTFSSSSTLFDFLFAFLGLKCFLVSSENIYVFIYDETVWFVNAFEVSLAHRLVDAGWITGFGSLHVIPSDIQCSAKHGAER